jgi:hypothetical protein
MKWIKPNGTEIETNDREETIEYCKSLGWKDAAEKKPRGRPRKEVTDSPDATPGGEDE